MRDNSDKGHPDAWHPSRAHPCSSSSGTQEDPVARAGLGGDRNWCHSPNRSGLQSAPVGGVQWGILSGTRMQHWVTGLWKGAADRQARTVSGPRTQVPSPRERGQPRLAYSVYP